MTKRKAIQDILYNQSIDIEENSEDINLPSELETLILYNIKSNRKRLSKKMQKLLQSPVVARGKTFASPENCWIASNLFKRWCEERLTWLSQQPNSRVEQAVHIIRNYGADKYGWLDFIDKNRDIMKSEFPIIEAKLGYGDD